MSYLHIENLYKNRDILLFKECYAMEKIHGTSAHISWKDNQLFFFSGGVSYDLFCLIFDKEHLISNFKEYNWNNCTIYGEAYGGKCQGMRETYGDTLRFVAFEVKIGDSWLCVPAAEKIVRDFGLDFVPYVKVLTDIDTLNCWRDYPSQQAIKNGIYEEKKREGIVLRPLIEVIKNNGQRIIAKHKSESFSETKTPRNIKDNDEKLKTLTIAKEIAQEWVTPMRLNHILDKFPNASIENTREIINCMIDDIAREAEGEIVLSKEAKGAIGKETAILFKQHLNNFAE